MADIYDQHKTAFASVSAYVVLHKGELVARIAFKFPRDGAGRLFAYVHWLGLPMVRGFAAGGGYDKGSAACASAMKRAVDPPEVNREWPKDRVDAWDMFRRELAKDDGHTWNDRLRKVGFDVISAV